jgi:hypothetical protein
MNETNFGSVDLRRKSPKKENGASQRMIRHILNINSKVPIAKKPTINSVKQ